MGLVIFINAKSGGGKGLQFTPDKAMKLYCYVDADFAGLWNYESDQDLVCVKSRTGYVITLGNCPVVWLSKLQMDIALEADYIALCTLMLDLHSLQKLLKAIGNKLKLEFVKLALIHSMTLKIIMVF